MKTILITGANRGLGLEMVRQYLETGWRVLACCRSPGDARELKSLSVPQLQIFKLDVNLDQDILNLSSQLHNQPIDILVNNAGILKTYHPNSQKLVILQPFYGHIENKYLKQNYCHHFK